MAKTPRPLGPRLLGGGALAAAVTIFAVARSGGVETRSSVAGDAEVVRTDLDRVTLAPAPTLAALIPDEAPAPTEDLAFDEPAVESTAQSSLQIVVVGLGAEHAALAVGSADVRARVGGFEALDGTRPAAVALDATFEGDTLRFDGFPADHTAVVTVEYGPEDARSTLELRVEGPKGTQRSATRRFDLARARRQEAAALEAMRTIATAQAQVQAAGQIDTDADGTGEYAYLAELAGTRPVRGYDANTGGTALLDVFLDPARLGPAFGDVRAASGGGYVEREGYAFRVFLPSGDARPFGALPEDITGGNGPVLPAADAAETHWCAYAWPLEDDGLPRRAFFVDATREVHATANDGASPYVGANGGPAFDAALVTSGDLGASVATSVRSARATDGNVWRAVGR